MTPEALTDSWLSSVLPSDVVVRGTRRISDGLLMEDRSPAVQGDQITLCEPWQARTASSETMSAAMATRHSQHVLDHESGAPL
ncbi:MAG: hypothetical protein ABI894_09530 [Ilumatobacteraceae bacterium]